MNLPIVCVVICTHNYGQYIESAIDSVLAQDYPHELIKVCIVDDNSTDNTESIVVKKLFSQSKISVNTRFETIFDNIDFTYIKNTETLGPSESRNLAIEASIDKTHVYMILDADDEMYPNKISKCVEKMISQPGIGVVYADYDILNVETGNLIREYKEPFDKSRLYQECIVHSGALINKVALATSKDEFGYYDSNMRTCEDYDLWLRISENFMIVHIPEPLSLVRVHKKNSTDSVSKEIWNRNWQRIADKLKHREHVKNIAK